MMHRLFEMETREPAAMQLGPCRAPVMAALAQQKPRELLTRAAQGPYRVEAGTHQVAHRLMSGIGNPHRRQLADPVQLRQTSGVPPIRLDPVARPLRDQRWRHDNAFVPKRRQLALDAITARPRLLSFRHLVKRAFRVGIDIPSRHGCLSFGRAQRSSPTAA